MIIAIIIGIIFLLGTVGILITKDPDIADKRSSNIGFLFLICLSLLVVMLLVSLAANAPVNQKCSRSIFKIKSLNRERETEGSGSSIFIIGSAYVNEQVYYYFYMEVETGIYQLQKERRENVFIKESDSTTPNVEVEECEYIPNESLWLLNITPAGYPNEYKYILTLPVGSIIKEYNP